MACPRAAAMRSRASASKAPAQCSAVSSPRLWPTATSASMPRSPQQPERRQRRGDDRRLGHVGRAQVARRGEARPLVEVLHGREPAAPGPAVERRRRSLAGEQEPDPRRETRPPEEDVGPRDRAGRSCHRRRRARPRDRADPATIPAAPPARPGGPPRSRRGRPDAPSDRRPGARPGRSARPARAARRISRRSIDLSAQVGGVAPAEQEQLGVLGRGEQGAFARAEPAAAIRRRSIRGRGGR